MTMKAYKGFNRNMTCRGFQFEEGKTYEEKGAIDFVFASVKKSTENVTANNDDSAKMASSGYSAKMASSGYSAKMASSGDYAKMELNGQYAVGAAIGINSKIRGKAGNWITLAEYDDDCKVVCVKSAQIDGEMIKTDTWYQLKDGEFVEVED